MRRPPPITLVDRPGREGGTEDRERERGQRKRGGKRERYPLSHNPTNDPGPLANREISLFPCLLAAAQLFFSRFLPQSPFSQGTIRVAPAETRSLPGNRADDSVIGVLQIAVRVSFLLESAASEFRAAATSITAVIVTGARIIRLTAPEAFFLAATSIQSIPRDIFYRIFKRNPSHVAPL